MQRRELQLAILFTFNTSVASHGLGDSESVGDSEGRELLRVVGLSGFDQQMLYRLVRVRLEDLLPFFGIPSPATDHYVGRRWTQNLEQNGRCVEVVVDILVVKGWGRLSRLAVEMGAASFGAEANPFAAEEATTSGCATNGRLSHRPLKRFVPFKLPLSRHFVFGIDLNQCTS